MSTNSKVENEYKRLSSGNDEAFNELFDNFWGIFIDDCYPEFKAIVATKFKPYLSQKLNRELQDDEVLTIVKSHLDGIAFDFNECL